MRNKTIYGLLIILTLVFCLSVAPSANAASDEEEIIQLSKTFLKAVQIGDSKLLNSLYWKSPKISSWGPGGGGAFLSQGWEEGESEPDTNELSATTSVATLHHPQVIMLGKDAAVTTVYHQWTYTNRTTQEQTFMYVRQTEVVKKIDGKWMFVHVHASILPVQ